MGGSKFGAVMTEYRQQCNPGTTYCTGAAIGNPSSVYGGYWYDTGSVPTSPSVDQLKYVANYAANYVFKDLSYNAQYVIALPPGHFDQQSNAKGWCAWHGWTQPTSSAWVTYTSLPYQLDNTCWSFYNVNGSNSANDAV